MSMNFGHALRLLTLTLALLLPALGAAEAQAPVPPGPNALTGPGITNDQLLLQQLQGDLRGRVSIPDQKAAMLIQPEGPEWRTLRNGTLKTVSAVALLGMVAALVVFYMVRGKIRIDAGPSLRRIQRLNGMERFAH